MADKKARDTQWPAYLVFHQKAEGQAHTHAGSVHAPDGEMALMNARDVFVRRPSCVSLWVARGDKVFAKTRQELDAGEMPNPNPDDTRPLRPYYVFKKNRHKGSCAFRGIVESVTPEEALHRALDKFPPRDSLWWWVIPEDAITKTEDADQEPLFEPASRKVFRHQSDFNTLTLMRKISKDAARIEEDPEDGS